MVARDTVVKEARDVEEILSLCKTKSDLLAVIEQYGLDKNSVTVWPRYVPKESSGKSWKKLDELKEDETFLKFCIDSIWPDSHISVYEYSVDQKNLRFEVWDSSIDTRAPISRVETVESFIKGYDALEQNIKSDVSEEIYVKTNIGTMPIEDYYEIRAIQCGFDDYMSMVKAGYHFDISDIDPESLVVKEKYYPASEKDEITQMLDSLSDKADKVIDSIDKDITKMAEKGEMEWEI